ncbi:MAG: MFS transporter [Candidatus Algichlamydia australiensis]|nr:MFS transporter [Chlamydiales bacterium]
MKKVTFSGVAIWVVGLLFYLFEFFLGVFPGTIAPELMESFSINAEEFAIVGAGYYIVYGLMQVPVGLLVKKFGTRLVLTFASSICTLGTLWFSFTTSFISALFSRMMMGFGASFGFVSMLVLVLNWFPRKNFGLFSGLSQLVGTVGPILAGGPLAFLLRSLGGDWQLILRGFAAVGATITVLIYLVVRNKPDRAKNTLVYLTPSHSLRKDLKNLLKRRRVWFIVLYAGIVYSSAPLLGAYWGTTFLATKGYSKEIAASIISLIWLGMAIGSPTWGWLSDRVKRRKSVLSLAALIGLVSSSLLFFPINQEFILIAVIFFLGLASAGQALSFASATETVPTALHSACIGLNNCLVILCSSFVPPFCSSIIQSASPTINGVVTYTEESFTKGLAIIPILFLLAFLISTFLIKETFCRQQHEVHLNNNS